MKLELRNAGFAYGSTSVFKNLSFGVDDGDILCLLGPNGTGKTTLFKAILGLLKLDEGSVFYAGEDISGFSRRDIARFIGYVPQNHNPPFPFSVLDVVLMGRTAHLNNFASPTKRDVQVAEGAMETLGIMHLKDKVYTEISGGERQLVLVARALAQEPKVLVMDEPTSNLDFGNQVRVLSHIERLAKSGLVVIMSSHLPDHAFLCATRVALMKDGGIFAIGEPDRVVTEENLREIYGVNVRIVEASDGHKVCIPVY